MPRSRGQVLVELAVALPFILFLMIGSMEAGLLLIAKAHQDRATAVVVQWAVTHPGESWNSIANRELPACTVTTATPLKDLLVMTAECHYNPVVLVMWNGLPMTSTESAAIPSKLVSPSPSPVPSPSSSLTIGPSVPPASMSVP